jgi:hypothetical protein
VIVQPVNSLDCGWHPCLLSFYMKCLAKLPSDPIPLTFHSAVGLQQAVELVLLILRSIRVHCFPFVCVNLCIHFCIPVLHINPSTLHLVKTGFKLTCQYHVIIIQKSDIASCKSLEEIHQASQQFPQLWLPSGPLP